MTGQEDSYQILIFGIVVLVANIVLTVTDQLGLLDLVTLVIDLILLGLLTATRSKYSTNR